MPNTLTDCKSDTEWCATYVNEREVRAVVLGVGLLAKENGMTTPSHETLRDPSALREQLQAALEKITELEEKLSQAEQVQQAGTVLLIAALVNRLGGEVVLSNTEMAAISGELQSHETFGGRVFKLVEGADDGDEDEDEEEGYQA